MKSTIRTFVLSTTILMTGSISASYSQSTKSTLPPSVSQQGQNLHIVGETRMKKFGLHIYDASLWTSTPDNPDSPCQHSCALSIVYARNIAAHKLVNVTEKEWKKLGINKTTTMDLWLTQLTELWPDVSQGDQLVMIKQRDGSGTFFSKENKLGTISDPEFADTFLAIWLDSKSRYKKHRRELMNE